MAQSLVTFGDIVDGIREAVGIQSADTAAINKIKRFVQMYYIDEVVPFKDWPWLEKTTTVVHKAYHNVGTVTVTPQSTTVTFGTAPNVSLGSFKGYRFAVNGSNKVYTVASHTAASTTVVLTGAYQEDLNTAAEYKIWRDKIDLPTTAKSTTQLSHAEQSKPLDAVGSKGFRKLETHDPKLEGFPTHYFTADFFDPSASDGESESDRYRQVKLYPSITADPVTINVDYTQEAVELDNDDDEPLMPVSDRVVLYYGAGAMAWSILSRKEDMHDRWLAKANAKLARMAGDREEGMDTPSLSPKSSYLNSIRRSGLKSRQPGIAAHAGGSSSVSPPSYLEGVTINGATITGNVTVNNDTTIDGRDLSEDGELLDSLEDTINEALETAEEALEAAQAAAITETEQILLNNNSSTIAGLTLNSSQYSYYKIRVMSKRRTADFFRRSVYIVEAFFLNEPELLGEWVISKEETIPDGLDSSGLTFAKAGALTTATTITYTSDDLTGTGYEGKFRWAILERCAIETV